MKRRTRLLSAMLAALIVLSCVPVSAAAHETEYLPECETDSAYLPYGVFYLASAGAEIAENAGRGYLLKVARVGDGEEAASVRLTMTDITASIGKDYTVSLYGSSLFDGNVQNRLTSESVLEFLEKNEYEEYNYSDALIDGTITAEDQLTDKEIEEAVFSEEEKSEIESASSELMNAIAGTSSDESAPKGALSAARELATGLADDREPMSFGTPNASDAVITPDSAVYMTESIAEINDALDSSYIIIDFGEGVTERYVEIVPRDNKKSDGNRQSDFSLTGVDGAQVSGMYCGFTLKLIDDEPFVPDVVEFSDAEYYPEDGYVTVTVRRSGNLTGVVTAMLDTVDDTALGGLDYSEVHAKLVFGFGVDERKIKIPVSSESLTADVRFKIILSDPQECTTGKKNTAFCVIGKDAKSFKFLSKTSALLGATEDMNLDTVMTGGEICLPDLLKSTKLPNDESRSQAYGENGWMLYAHKHGNDVGVTAVFELDERHFDYTGYEIYWSRVAGKPTWGNTSFYSYTSYSSEEGRYGEYDYFYNKDTERWTNDVDRYYMEHEATDELTLHLFAETGLLATNPTLEVYYIKPIMRPFRITLMGADPIKLIDSEGNKVDNTEIAEYATENEVLLLNSDSNSSVVTVSGYPVTFELRNNVAPICYISGLYLVNTETGEKVLVKEFSEGTTSASLVLTNDLIADNLGFVEFKDNGKHGLYGAVTVQPRLSNMPATVHVEKSGFGDVTVWDGKIIPAVYDDAKETVYRCCVGDCIRYSMEVSDEYSSVYDWERVRIDTVLPANRQPYDIYRTSGKDYAQDSVGASEIKVSPIISEGKNRLLVRIRQDDLALFDTTTGIFLKPYTDFPTYREYSIDATHVSGNNYELTANAVKGGYVAEWCSFYNSAVKYSQNTFYFTGASDQINNTLYLTAKRSDVTGYSFTGNVYYDDSALGGKVSAEAWYPASGVFCIIDSAHYGIADMNGQVKTAPVSGIAGDYIRLKITTAGYDKYTDILLEEKNLTTTEYDTGDGGKYTVSCYALDMGNRVVSSNSTRRPYIKSITALQNLIQLSSTTVKINNRPTQFTVNVTTIDPATHKPYSYTYIDKNGEEQTRTERPIALDIIIVDPVTHEEKFVITGAKDYRGDGTTWKVSYTFTHDEYNLYKAGDLVYARLTTDRFIGDGCAEDKNGERVPTKFFRESVCAPVRTKMVLSGVNPQEPHIVDINIDPTNHIPQAGNYYNLPIIGDLTMMINACGLSFGIAETETGGVRLFFGKQITSLTKNSHFDGNGNAVSDTGFAIDSDNFRSSFSDMKNTISTFGGTNRLGAMALGIPAWSFEPMAGIYLEFAVYNDRVSEDQDRLEFVGGGGYIGCIANFRYTYYMIVYGVPVYVGGDVSVTLMAELGIAADKDKHIFFSGPDQEFMDEVIDNSHFQFVFMAMVTGNAYAGIGICGTLGVRGGFTLILKFIVNPMVTKSYPSVRSTGFEVTGMIKFWADMVLLSVPASLFSWDLLKLGYFKDIDDLKEDNPGGLFAPSVSQAIYSKPRDNAESNFIGDKPFVQSTFSGISSRTIVKNSYDDAKQKLIPLGDGRILMVYLDDDKSRDDSERTVLKYSVYEGGEWSEPAVIQNDGTADFSPGVCDVGNDILITWVSRPEGTKLDDYRTYLSSTEIYTVRMNKSTLSLGPIERLTDDGYYDTDPAAVYDSVTGDVVVTYLKSEVGEITGSAELLRNALPYTNGSVLMYMLYDGASGKWVRDKFYENELADPSKADTLLAEFGGQRFVPTAAFGMTNPIISDLTSDTAVITNLNAADIENFNAAYASKKYGYTRAADGSLADGDLDDMEKNVMFSEDDLIEYNTALDEFRQKYTKPYGMYAYTVDRDNDLSTDNDREVFVQLYDFEEHLTWDSIQITSNDENDSAPELIHVGDNAYLFWLHDGKEIRYINATDTMCEADSDGFVRYRTVTAKNTDKDIENLSISSFKAFSDNDGNLFVAWQQNSSQISEDDAALNPTEDIYLAGYVSYTDENESYSSWSDAVRMTNNGKLNELPEFADLGDGRLMMVNSQYDIDMNGDLYSVSDVNLVETDYITVGSLTVVDVVPHTVPKKAGDVFDVDIVIRNDGVKGEEGFEYSGALMAGGKAVKEFSGKSVGTSVPAGQTVTVTERFTLPDIAADSLDSLNIKMYIKENGTPKPVLSGAPIFDGKARYELDELTAVQDGDSFIISGMARNVGSSNGDGTDTVDIYSDGDDTLLASAVLGTNAEINTSVPFSAAVKIDADDAKYGFVNYSLIVTDDGGAPISDVETVRAAVVNPFGLVLNGDKNLTKITLNEGDSLTLSATYEPTAFYRNADAKYAVDDQRIATVKDDKLIALEPGETVLRMTVAPYGGSKSVSVKVEGEEKPKETVILEDMNNEYEEILHRYVLDNLPGSTSGEDGTGGETVEETSPDIPVCPKDATCPLDRFTDTENGAWYHDGVHYCLENGIMNGVDGTRFSPDGTITRAMTVTMLWRLDGEKYANYAMRFTDVPDDEWYTEAVRWAAAEKIVTGHDSEHFAPNDPVTREQLAVILYRYAQHKGQGFKGSWMFLLDFTDRADISEWADEAVHWCSMKGIVTGKDGKLFDPQGKATRAEAAAMIERFCGCLEK